MSVTVRDGDSDVTIDLVVPGPKVILYDCEGTPLKRPIGFSLGRRGLDNRPTGRVNCATNRNCCRSAGAEA